MSKKYDVLIAGGGTAGVCAALAASALGLSCLVVERLSFLGGAQTAGLVQPMMRLGIPGREYAGAVNRLLVQKLEATGQGHGNWFDPEALKGVLEQQLALRGCDVLYDSQIVGAAVEEGTIKSVCVAAGGKTQHIAATSYIDATGNADLSALAGVPFSIGLSGADTCQPVSLRFEMSGVDLRQFGDYLAGLGQKDALTEAEFETAYTPDRAWPLTPVFEQAVKAGTLYREDCSYFQLFSVPGRPGVLSFNCPEIGVLQNPLDPAEATRAYKQGRAAINRLSRFMRQSFPGFAGASVSCVASQLGIRDSRRIEGVKTLTRQDITGYTKFTDAIMASNYYVDIHGLSAEEQHRLTQANRQLPQEEQYYTIPFGCCVPVNIDNLLVAGRCISADFYAQAAIRIQLVCRGIGEACGAAAYAAVTQNKPFHSIDISDIERARQKLGETLEEIA